MDNAAVTQHYNERREQGKAGRQQSQIIGLRKFNNWVKSVLINLHTRPGVRVLDLCCGKGGDLNKWTKARVSEYTACDTAPVSVSQLRDRYNDLQAAPFRPRLLVGDCFAVRLADYFPADTVFDVVSCQFAMHYAFESEERVRQMLLNVTERLRPGGFFIGTTTDANVLVRKLRAVEGLTIGNNIFKVDLDERYRDKRFPRGSGAQYGIRYSFTLDENVDDCPEYMVHFPLLEEVAKEYELELVLLRNFHDFYAEFCGEDYDEFRALFARMGVADGQMLLDEWDAIFLYTAFAFKKIGDPNADLPEAGDPRRRWPPVEDDEIVVMQAGGVQAGGMGATSGDGDRDNGTGSGD